MQQVNKNQKPDNYLVWAILSTIFCCLPTGIVSIVHASKVDSLWHSGNQAEALERSEKAKNWAIYSLVAGIIAFIITIILEIFVLGALASLSDDETDTATGTLLEQVQASVQEANDECPMEMDKGMTITQVSMSEDNMYVMYLVACDDDYIDTDDISENRDEIKSNLQKHLKKNNELFEPFKEAGIGIVYHFYDGDDEDDFVQIVIGSHEL